LNNREELAKRDKGKTYPEWYAFDDPSQYCISDKNAYLYTVFIDPNNNRTKCISHTPKYFTPQLFCIEPNTEADIDILRGVLLIILILFHRIRLNAAGMDKSEQPSFVGSPLVSV
jgi:hypothetical protein